MTKKNTRTSRKSLKKTVLSKKYWFQPIRSSGSKILSKLIETDDTYGFNFSGEPKNPV